FHETVQYQELDKIAKNFNENIETKRSPKCSVSSSSYVAEQKQKRAQKIANTETNRCILLKNVSARETLQEMEYDMENDLKACHHKSDIFEHKKCKKGMQELLWTQFSQRLRQEKKVQILWTNESRFRMIAITKEMQREGDVFCAKTIRRLHFMSYHPENNVKDWIIFQNNINGFDSKAQLLEQNLR
ncbi:hypothetical protein RFI_02225, partial [Reticulomyxa filosa]